MNLFLEKWEDFALIFYKNAFLSINIWSTSMRFLLEFKLFQEQKHHRM